MTQDYKIIRWSKNILLIMIRSFEDSVMNELILLQSDK